MNPTPLLPPRNGTPRLDPGAPLRALRKDARPADGQFRLESFAVGEANQVTYLAACKVRDGDASFSQPLYIYGKSGLGKTHILQGIFRAFREKDPGARIEYVTGEQFSNIFRERLRKAEIATFRDRFRSLDLLVVDDVQSLAGKTATQAEFLYTFEELHGRGRPIVLASDRHPKEMHALSPSLVGRFLAGFVVRLDPPDPATRLQILRGRCGQFGHTLGDDVLRILAEETRGSVRETVGALTRVMAHADLCEEKVDAEAVHRILDELRETSPRQVTFREVEKAVTRYFGIRLSDLRSRSKKRAMTLPRQIAMYLARRHGGYSLKEIGARYGGKSHTTVTHSEGRIRQLMEEDPSVRRTVDLLQAEIAQG